MISTKLLCIYTRMHMYTGHRSSHYSYVYLPLSLSLNLSLSSLGATNVIQSIFHHKLIFDALEPAQLGLNPRACIGRGGQETRRYEFIKTMSPGYSCTSLRVRGICDGIMNTRQNCAKMAAKLRFLSQAM